jgi:endo-1,3(4)-beta-glucanase
MTSLSLDNPQAFSVFVNLQHQLGAPPAITFPLLQGMGFVTGIYNNARPVIESGVGFRSITRVPDFSASLTQKYRILLEDGKTVSEKGSVQVCGCRAALMSSFSVASLRYRSEW